jgi:Caenorhabditis protein of unknown function, DUF268
MGLSRLLFSVGIDLKRARLLRFVPRYWADRIAFKRAGGVISRSHAIYDDYQAQAGTASGHYFHQDLLVATRIHQAAPRRHIDVGSRIDGFVAHVASFRAIEVLDIRPLANPGHERIAFLQRDMMASDSALEGICDSLSCLHALEHFGLGRYGDPINPGGHLQGFEGLHRMLEPAGRLYLSVPIGRSGVHFNAHRVFAADEVLGWARGRFDLEHFDYVDDAGALHRDADPNRIAPGLRFGCGIYTLRKHALAAT